MISCYPHRKPNPAEREPIVRAARSVVRAMLAIHDETGPGYKVSCLLEAAASVKSLPSIDEIAARLTAEAARILEEIEAERAREMTERARAEAERRADEEREIEGYRTKMRALAEEGGAR